MITHGEDYLAPPEAFIEQPKIEKIKDSIHLYEKVVSVILEDKVSAAIIPLKVEITFDWTTMIC